MAKLVYSMLVSLDGFVETTDRKIDWIPMDEELHRFFNEQARDYGLSLYGRRLYEVMVPWYSWDTDPSASDYEVEFARIWQSTPKLVFSKTLTEVGPNATLVREIIPDEIVKLKEQSSKNIEVGGPTLAAHFMRLGLIDEYHISVCPVILGGGTPFFPSLDRRVNLTLVEQRKFSSGVSYLRYESRKA
jgi:dihydrofolate reductase